MRCRTPTHLVLVRSAGKSTERKSSARVRRSLAVIKHVYCCGEVNRRSETIAGGTVRGNEDFEPHQSMKQRNAARKHRAADGSSRYSASG